MNKKKQLIAKKVLLKIAQREGKNVEQIRRDIKAAMLVGMLDPDPKVQAYWNKIPRKGDYPTPEEVIAYVAGEII